MYDNLFINTGVGRCLTLLEGLVSDSEASLSTALGLQDEIGYAVARAHGRQLRGPPVTLRVRVVDRTMKKMSPLKVRPLRPRLQGPVWKRGLPRVC